MENKKSLGEFIQSKRMARGLTQKQLAEQLHITESAVSKWVARKILCKVQSLVFTD